MGQHGSALGSILLGLDGFEVTAAEVIDDECRLGVQTAAILAWHLTAGCCNGPTEQTVGPGDSMSYRR